MSLSRELQSKDQDKNYREAVKAWKKSERLWYECEENGFMPGAQEEARSLRNQAKAIFQEMAGTFHHSSHRPGMYLQRIKLREAVLSGKPPEHIKADELELMNKLAQLYYALHALKLARGLWYLIGNFRHHKFEGQEYRQLLEGTAWYLLNERRSKDLDDLKLRFWRYLEKAEDYLERLLEEESFAEAGKWPWFNELVNSYLEELNLLRSKLDQKQKYDLARSTYEYARQFAKVTDFHCSKGEFEEALMTCNKRTIWYTQAIDGFAQACLFSQSKKFSERAEKGKAELEKAVKDIYEMRKTYRRPNYHKKSLDEDWIFRNEYYPEMEEKEDKSAEAPGFSVQIEDGYDICVRAKLPKTRQTKLGVNDERIEVDYNSFAELPTTTILTQDGAFQYEAKQDEFICVLDRAQLLNLKSYQEGLRQMFNWPIGKCERLSIRQALMEADELNVLDEALRKNGGKGLNVSKPDEKLTLRLTPR